MRRMAVNHLYIDAQPEEVFSYLADGRTYAEWVVGAKRIRAVDSGWPAPGTRIHHTVGGGPFTLDDHTEVLEVEPNRRLVLDARARPFGRARVELHLEPTAGGTEVVMRELPVSLPGVAQGLLEPLLHLRNGKALRRLRDGVRRRAQRVTQG